MKIKKGDTVVVIAGKDKGAKGKVIAAYPRQEMRRAIHKLPMKCRIVTREVGES